MSLKDKHTKQDDKLVSHQENGEQKQQLEEQVTINLNISSTSIDNNNLKQETKIYLNENSNNDNEEDDDNQRSKLTANNILTKNTNSSSIEVKHQMQNYFSKEYQAKRQENFISNCNELKITDNNNSLSNWSDDDDEDESEVTIADVVGQYGLFQFLLTLLSFMRYICMAMMTNSEPQLAPDIRFWCVDEGLIGNFNNSSNINDVDLRNTSSLIYNSIINNQLLLNKCFLTNGTKCTRFVYELNEYGQTLTNTFDLVCDRQFYRSAYQSTITFSFVPAGLFWGYFSDRYGRSKAIHLCYLGSLLFGYLSSISSSILMFSIMRSLCTFSDLGIVTSAVTIGAETIGIKYRGSSLIGAYTGWAISVMLMPFVCEYAKNFRFLMLIIVALHLSTVPFLFIVGESPRWLLMNARFADATKELIKIRKFNLVARRLFSLKRWRKFLFNKNNNNNNNNNRKKKNIEESYDYEFNNENGEQENCFNQQSTTKFELQSRNNLFKLTSNFNSNNIDKDINDVMIEEEENEFINSNECYNIIKNANLSAKQSAKFKTNLKPLLVKYKDISSRHKQVNIIKQLSQIFTTNQLLISTLTIVWIAFNVELFYMLTILVGSVVSENEKLTYLLGGSMEIMSTFVCIIIVSRVTRKSSLAIVLIIISASSFCMSLSRSSAFYALLFLNIAKFATSTLSSLSFLVTSEIYPTSLRQTGYGISSTLSVFGGIIAPHFRDKISAEWNAEPPQTQVFLILLSLIPLSAAAVVMFLEETFNRDLKDEIETEHNINKVDD